jgi:hypothetical protein
MQELHYLVPPLVSTLPSSGTIAGAIVRLSTDGKLYERSQDNAVWSELVPASATADASKALRILRGNPFLFSF